VVASHAQVTFAHNIGTPKLPRDKCCRSKNWRK
jgi:hypothetical protein